MTSSAVGDAAYRDGADGHVSVPTSPAAPNPDCPHGRTPPVQGRDTTGRACGTARAPARLNIGVFNIGRNV